MDNIYIYVLKRDDPNNKDGCKLTIYDSAIITTVNCANPLTAALYMKMREMDYKNSEREFQIFAVNEPDDLNIDFRKYLKGCDIPFNLCNWTDIYNSNLTELRYYEKRTITVLTRKIGRTNETETYYEADVIDNGRILPMRSRGLSDIAYFINQWYPADSFVIYVSKDDCGFALMQELEKLDRRYHMAYNLGLHEIGNVSDKENTHD